MAKKYGHVKYATKYEVDQLRKEIRGIAKRADASFRHADAFGRQLTKNLTKSNSFRYNI